MKYTYRELKSMQTAQINAQLIRYCFHRSFSTLFTFLFLKLGFTANFVTFLAILAPIFGFVVLLYSTYLAIILAMLLFTLFHVLDCSDGELARIKDQQSIEGKYLDEISHYIYSICLGFGVGYSINNFILGFILVVVFVLEYAIAATIRSFLKNYREFFIFLYKQKTFSSLLMLVKLLNIYPIQGLVWSVYFIPLIVLLLAALALIYNHFPLIIYLWALAISKSIWTILTLNRIVFKQQIKEFIQKGAS